MELQSKPEVVESTCLIIGHRGAAAVAPENTLGGFRKAAEAGADWVELDVILTADGVPVVSHDLSLKRCCRDDRYVDQMNLAELDALNAAAFFEGWQPEALPTLHDTLVLLESLGLGLNLEIKQYNSAAEQIAKSVIDEVARTFSDSSKLIISSFDYDVLRACRSLDANIQLGILYESLPDHWLEQAQQIAAVSIHLGWWDLNFRQASAIKQAGYALYLWTANEPALCESFRAWGVDGIITDDPARFQSWKV